MVGGGNRKVEGSFTVCNSNVFAVLERKKKKSDKDKGSAKSSKTASNAGIGKSKEPKEEKPQVFWAPAPLTVKSWADVDDEDDDDYYATTAPPPSVWGVPASKPEGSQKPDPVEESESEDDDVDEGDDDVEEEHDHQPVVDAQLEPDEKKPVEASSANKETDKQLSKKERRKKELEELEAILAEIGVAPKERAENESSDVSREKEGQMNGDTEKKDNVQAESKSSKKKKRKDKASKEAKERQDQPSSSDVPNGKVETTAAEQVDADASSVNVKERLKKVAAAKKKKSNKEMDASARAAAVEAAARSAKLAAAKKKEKNHYNQQPLR